MTSTPSLAAALPRFLRHIPLLPRRLLLHTSGVLATVPMLRGTWGAALHDLDPVAYQEVFHPGEQPHAVPAYVMRPAPPDPQFAPALDWILIGPAIAHDATLRRAWDIASGMGLGPERRRFHLRDCRLLDPAGQSTANMTDPWHNAAPWTLDRARWPLDDPHTPCRLTFFAPLRLLRQKRLIERPTLADLTVAATRRIGAYLPGEHHHGWENLAREALEYSRHVPAGEWAGQRLDLHRYSASQKADLDLRGVAGTLYLPAGPQELAPLLTAALWLGLGKSTILGLGQFEVTHVE